MDENESNPWSINGERNYQSPACHMASGMIQSGLLYGEREGPSLALHMESGMIEVWLAVRPVGQTIQRQDPFFWFSTEPSLISSRLELSLKLYNKNCKD